MKEKTMTDQAELKDVEKKLTPEEKLFRVITAAGGTDAELEDLISKYAPSASKTARLTSQWQHGFGQGLELLVSLRPLSQTITLVFLGIVTFYFLSGIWVGRIFYFSPAARLGEIGLDQSGNFFPKFFKGPHFTENLKPEVPTPQTLSTAMPAAAPVPVPETVSLVDKNTGAFKAPVNAEPTAVVPAAPFKLVGISTDKDGKVAMVEVIGDTHARFVRKGDVLPGNTRVEEVKDYSVVVAAGDQKWEVV